jgi:hypothetical protein
MAFQVPLYRTEWRYRRRKYSTIPLPVATCVLGNSFGCIHLNFNPSCIMDCIICWYMHITKDWKWKSAMNSYCEEILSSRGFTSVCSNYMDGSWCDVFVICNRCDFDACYGVGTKFHADWLSKESQTWLTAWHLLIESVLHKVLWWESLQLKQEGLLFHMLHLLSNARFLRELISFWSLNLEWRTVWCKINSSSVTSNWSSSIMNWRFSRCHWGFVFSFFNSLARMIIPYVHLRVHFPRYYLWYLCWARFLWLD